MSELFFTRAGRWAPIAALVVSSVVIVSLSSIVRDQEADRRDIRRRMALLHEGYFIPAMTLHADDGAEVKVGSPPAGGHQLLFVYSETCEFSRDSATPWGTLVEELQSRGLPVTPAALLVDDPATPLPPGMERWSPPGGAVRLPDARSRFLMRSGVVPQIVLIDSSGQVVYNRSGVLDLPTVRDSLLSYMAGLMTRE